MDFFTGRNSPEDLDKLIQNFEFENKHYVKLIEKENLQLEALEQDIAEKKKISSELEEQTSHLDEETKRGHKQFRQNRDNCDSLRKTAAVLLEHETALVKNLQSVVECGQKESNERQSVVQHYTTIWEDYSKKYESFPLAKILKDKQSFLQLLQNDLDSARTKLQELNDSIRSLQKGADEVDFYSLQSFIIKVASRKLENDSHVTELAKQKQEAAAIIDEIERLRASNKIQKEQQEQDETSLQHDKQSAAVIHMNNISIDICDSSEEAEQKQQQQKQHAYGASGDGVSVSGNSNEPHALLVPKYMQIDEADSVSSSVHGESLVIPEDPGNSMLVHMYQADNEQHEVTNTVPMLPVSSSPATGDVRNIVPMSPAVGDVRHIVPMSPVTRDVRHIVPMSPVTGDVRHIVPMSPVTGDVNMNRNTNAVPCNPNFNSAATCLESVYRIDQMSPVPVATEQLKQHSSLQLTGQWVQQQQQQQQQMQLETGEQHSQQRPAHGQEQRQQQPQPYPQQKQVINQPLLMNQKQAWDEQQQQEEQAKQLARLQQEKKWEVYHQQQLMQQQQQVKSQRLELQSHLPIQREPPPSSIQNQNQSINPQQYRQISAEYAHQNLGQIRQNNCQQQQQPTHPAHTTPQSIIQGFHSKNTNNKITSASSNNQAPIAASIQIPSQNRNIRKIPMLLQPTACMSDPRPSLQQQPARANTTQPALIRLSRHFVKPQLHQEAIGNPQLLSTLPSLHQQNQASQLSRPQVQPQLHQLSRPQHQMHAPLPGIQQQTACSTTQQQQPVYPDQQQSQASPQAIKPQVQQRQPLQASQNQSSLLKAVLVQSPLLTQQQQQEHQQQKHQQEQQMHQQQQQHEQQQQKYQQEQQRPLQQQVQLHQSKLISCSSLSSLHDQQQQSIQSRDHVVGMRPMVKLKSTWVGMNKQSQSSEVSKPEVAQEQGQRADPALQSPTVVSRSERSRVQEHVPMTIGQTSTAIPEAKNVSAMPAEQRTVARSREPMRPHTPEAPKTPPNLDSEEVTRDMPSPFDLEKHLERIKLLTQSPDSIHFDKRPMFQGLHDQQQQDKSEKVESLTGNPFVRPFFSSQDSQTEDAKSPYNGNDPAAQEQQQSSQNSNDDFSFVSPAAAAGSTLTREHTGTGDFSFTANAGTMFGPSSRTDSMAGSSLFGGGLGSSNTGASSSTFGNSMMAFNFGGSPVSGCGGGGASIFSMFGSDAQSATSNEDNNNSGNDGFSFSFAAASSDNQHSSNSVFSLF